MGVLERSNFKVQTHSNGFAAQLADGFQQSIQNRNPVKKKRGKDVRRSSKLGTTQ